MGQPALGWTIFFPILCVAVGGHVPRVSEEPNLRCVGRRWFEAGKAGLSLAAQLGRPTQICPWANYYYVVTNWYCTLFGTNGSSSCC